MFAAADITPYIKTWITVTAVFPINKVNFLIINEEIDVSSITVNVALLNAIAFCQGIQAIDSIPNGVKIRKTAVAFRRNPLANLFRLFDYIELPANATWRAMQIPKKHHGANHIIEISIVEVPMLNITAYPPAFLHIHGNKRRIYACLFNDLLHHGLPPAIDQFVGAETWMAKNILAAIKFEG